MLPGRLLSYDQTADRRIVPRWLGASDDAWLRELVVAARAVSGTAAGDADRDIVDTVTERALLHGVGRRVVEGAWTIERRRWRTRVAAKVPPEKIRRILFDLAAERPRDEAMALASKELGLEEEELLATLFADRPDARLLVPPETEATEPDLRDRYNLALAQSFLLRSSLVVATVHGSARQVIGQARRRRLMVGVTETGTDAGTETAGLRIAISGPLALFHDTLKYGRALAAWLPALVSTPSFALACRVVIDDEAFQLDLDPSAPLAAGQLLAPAPDDDLEERLVRDLSRSGSAWHIERESVLLRCGKALFFPDLVLVDPAGRRVAVEIAGFWTPEYLASKTTLLEGADSPVVLCVRYRRGAVLAHGPDVVGYEKTIDVTALVAAAEAALARFDARAQSAS